MLRTRSTLLFLQLALLSVNLGYGQTWSSQSIDLGEKPTMAIDQNGVIHIVYVDESFGSGYLGYTVVDGDNITSTKVAEERAFQGPAAIATSADGRVAVAVHDHRSEHESVFIFEDGSWAEAQLVSDNHDGWDNSIAFGSDGRVHTSSNDLADGIEYAVRTGTTWEKVALPTGGIFYRGGTSIILDGELPRIAYHDDKTEALNIVSFDESSKVMVARNLGGSWERQTVDTLVGNQSGAIHSTAIDFDSKGQLHVAYANRDVIKHAYYDGTDWVIDVVAGASITSGFIGASADLVVDDQDVPHVVYFEVPNRVTYAVQQPDTTRTDIDGDGFDAPEDCDDNDPNINPNAEEILDNDIDENCDGVLGVTETFTASGKIVDREGVGISNVIISVQGNPMMGTFTDREGNWSINNITEPIRVSWEKSGDARAGLSVQDVLLARNHIIGTVILDEASVMAADVNQNGSLSVTDMVQMTSVILERASGFSSGKIWMFDPPRLFIDPSSPPNSTQILGVKLGDTNGSANPKGN